MDGRVLHTSFHRMAALCLWVNLVTSLDEFFATTFDFADDHHVTAIHSGFDTHAGVCLRNRRSSRFTAANRGAGRTGTSWRAGRQVLEKEVREPLRWKRGKTGRRKKKRESPMNILEKIQARASEVVVVAG